ncbi:MAG: MerR family transcriptional regulator [Oscillospiraceae bacterium]
MTIREIEALSGMTRANIRFYESEGLLTPNRMENGYRDYTRSDLDTLHKIRLLRALGLGIDEIRKLSAGETALGEALESRLSAMQTEQRTLVRAEEVARAMLRAHADYATLDTGRYLAALEAGAQTAVQQDVQPKQHMLWQRFFARYLDVTLYHAFWVTLLPLLGYNLFRNRNGGAMLVQVLSLLTMFFLEPLLLHIFAATPGKWLFGLRVTDGDDGKLTYEAALNRTAFVFWYGIRLDLPVLRLVRLYKCAEDEQAGKALPWEADSEQTVCDRHGWRFAAAALLAIAVMAGAVLGVLLPIGTVHRGDLTVAQFAENYNAIQRQLGSEGIELDASGCWKAESVFETSGGTTTYMFRDRYPQFEYETENGILTAVIYRLESGTGNEVQASPDGNVLSLALYAFAGAETKYLAFDRALQTAAADLSEHRFSEFQTVVDGVDVSYRCTGIRAELGLLQNSYTLTLRKIGA